MWHIVIKWITGTRKHRIYIYCICDVKQCEKNSLLLLWSYFRGFKVILQSSVFLIVTVEYFPWPNWESCVGLMSQLTAGQRLTLTSIWSLGESRDAPVPALWSAPGTGPSCLTSCGATGTSPSIPGSNAWKSEMRLCQWCETYSLS